MFRKKQVILGVRDFILIFNCQASFIFGVRTSAGVLRGSSSHIFVFLFLIDNLGSQCCKFGYSFAFVG